MIITDSGGIQEEATAPPIRKPVLVIRLSTGRPEAVEAGFAKLVGVESHSILEAMKQTLDKKCLMQKISPYGDGTAAQKIGEILTREVESKLFNAQFNTPAYFKLLMSHLMLEV